MKSFLLVLFALLPFAHATQLDEQHARASAYSRTVGQDVEAVVEIQIDRGWHLYHGPTRDDLGPADAVGSPTTVTLVQAGVTWSSVRFPKPLRVEQDLGDVKTHIFVHRGKIFVYARGVREGGAGAAPLRATIKGETCADGDGGVCVPLQMEVTASGPGPDAAFAAFPSDLAPPRASATSDRIEPASSATPSTAQVAQSTDEGLVDALGADSELASSVTTPASSTSSDRADARTSSSSSPTAPAGSSASDLADTSSGVDPSGNLLQFLLLAVTWGFVTLLMPCTYPMIPITISFFTKQASARGGRVLPLSLCYGAGIVLIFVLIGVAVGPIIIKFATHPVTNLVIGALFLVFALALFGAIELRPPRFLMSAAGQASRKGGYVGVFVMGATLVVTSFTCTAPFVGSLLSFGAAGGDLFRIALGMSVFGLTLAIPFVLLSLLPAKLQSMPRSGEWMHTLKVFLGFVEVAASLKFLSNADLVWDWQWLNRELFLALWAGTFLVAAFYILGLVRLRDEGPEREIGPARLTSGLAALLFAAYCGYGVLGNRVDPIMTAILPPYSGHIATANGGAPTGPTAKALFKDDYDAALAQARSDNKLLLVNFTGITCVNCRLMEERVFPQPAIASELAKMIEVRLHTDGSTNIERILGLQRELTSSVAIPTYVLVDPKTGKKMRMIQGFRPVERFAAFLRG